MKFEEMIVDILEDYDPYSFMDAFDSKEEAIESVTESMNEHEYESILEELKDMKENDYEHDNLDYAIKKLEMFIELKNYVKENFKGE